VFSDIPMIAAPEPNTVRRWCSRLARVLLLCMLVAAAHAADPAKSLRVTFLAAETGLDPV
jgi:hypothetical protein